MATSALFTTIRVGSVELKNRIVMSALTRNRAESTYPTELMKEYYIQRADAGLIISEGILVTRQGYVAHSSFPPFTLTGRAAGLSGRTRRACGTIAMSRAGRTSSTVYTQPAARCTAR